MRGAHRAARLELGRGGQFGAQRLHLGQETATVGIARAVVPDESDALAGAHREINAVKRTDGAEVLFDAVQALRYSHEPRTPAG